MANANSTAKSGDHTTSVESEINRHAAHKRFSWLDEQAQSDPLARFVEQVKDVVSGVALVLEIVEMSDIQRKEASQRNPVAPIIHACDACTLRRFAITTSRMLAERAEDMCDWLNRQHKEGAI
jgi:hypothetical protein